MLFSLKRGGDGWAGQGRDGIGFKREKRGKSWITNGETLGRDAAWVQAYFGREQKG